jgi:peptidoglycan/xylan/chitin deacetylase (PgdA/CDA1 family)
MGVMADDTVFLAVDPQELSTQLVKKHSCNVKEMSYGLFDSLFSKTTYGIVLGEARQRDFPLQDAGITHSMRSAQGIDLTIDLCPSSKPLARSFFIRLIDAFDKEERPVPVSIAITGVWMKEHPDDFSWLVGLVSNGDLAITWINHSYSHRFSKTMPLKQNFLLEKGTNLENEVLGTEIALIDNVQIPSVFFRFPGLISDREIYLKVISYGLVPIGSDAWLAKNQQPHGGSIVLVHANGNEPLGLEKFFQLVKDKSSIIADKEWFLYDLSESLEREDSTTHQRE